MRRKTILIAKILLMVLSSSSICLGKYTDGNGEPNDPYIISTAEDLNDIGNHPEDFNKCFLMIADINLAGYTFTTAVIAPDTNSIERYFQGTAFTGTFDGNDHLIRHLTIDTNSAGNDFLGLFGKTSFSCEIMNLGIEDVNITGGDFTEVLGGLVGENDEGTISNCYAIGYVTTSGRSRYLGGLVGYNSDGEISNCYATGAVTGEDSLGGLVGSNSHGTIINCYASGVVIGGDDSYYLGGLMGLNEYGEINNCYATGAVKGEYFLGGLVGSNGGTVSNCYSIGTVIGYSDVGGLVGFDFSGGITASFWDIETGGPDNGIGTPLTKQEMQTESTFTDAGWDFIEIWNIGENQTYPFLRTHPAGDINHDDIVNFYDLAILADKWLQEK